MPVMTTNPAAWSRLIRFIAYEDGREHIGEPVDEEQDVGMAYHEKQRIEANVLDTLVAWDPLAQKTGVIMTVKELLSPIRTPPGPILATGLSYKDHAQELNLPFPSHPVLFFKPPTTLATPGEIIPIPKLCQNQSMDYEVELAVVLSRDAKNVGVKDAGDYILGYTVANDLTNRVWQASSSQWGYCKGFDKFLPLGPCLVSTRELPDASVLSLQTHLNGELMQNGKAKQMIFTITEVVSYLSQGTTLPAGTIIITGTPPGIGESKSPKVWLKDGDIVICSIDHGIGSLVNTIKYE